MQIDIINKKLEKKIIDENVIRQIATDEENIFFSKTTKDTMIQFIDDKTNTNKTSIELWKNLLIDSICLLKMNDKREKLYDIFKKIYDDGKGKKDFCNSFKKIRLMSSYGIDEIEKYFHDFVDFESVLYGTSKYYRDHILHILQVWGIGIGLICNHETDLKLTDKYICSKENFNFLLDKEDKKGKEENEEEKIRKKSISKSEIWAMWTIIALCHDLGYPIEKASQINQKTRKIINHFGCLNFQELNYSFEIFNGYIVEKFLNIISSKAVMAQNSPDNENKTAVQSKYHDKFSKSLEDFKHGMFSGLLIFKKLTYFLETDFYFENSELTGEDLRQFFIRKEILRAICSHTCPKIYHIWLNTFSFLLIFCDEIQEWNRPNFDDFRFRVTDKYPKVIIGKYELKGQKFKVSFAYENDCDKNNYNYLVLDRFKTLHYLLRSAKDDKDRDKEMFLYWEVTFENRKYTLKFEPKVNELKEITVYKAEKQSDGSFSADNEFDLYEKDSQEFS
ncbi:MAG: hypothetical protein JXB88_15005 [Spirochaetales bacterium]|nr:hypothetical protein [Spirochaetales bacterium]